MSKNRNIVLYLTAIAVIAGAITLFKEFFWPNPPLITQGGLVHDVETQEMDVLGFGEVRGNYGGEQAIIRYWNAMLISQGVSGSEKRNRIEKLTSQLNQTKEDWKNRQSDDSIIKEALKYLENGNLFDVEEVLISDLNKKIEEKDFRGASKRARDLSLINKIQLKYSKASNYVEITNYISWQQEGSDDAE